MANVNRANGFKPVKHLNGSPYNGQVRKYAAPAAETTAIGIGDFVKLSTKPVLADGVPGVESIGTGSVTSGNLVGVVVGVLAVNPSGGVSGGASPTLDLPQYKAASTLKYVLVADSPDLIFEGQEDSVGANLALTHIGLNGAIQGAAASTTTGLSGQTIDSSSTPTTTNTLPIQIVGAVQSPNNEFPGTYSRWLVRINNHAYSNAATGETRD